jgi:hypothetical protein
MLEYTRAGEGARLMMLVLHEEGLEAHLRVAPVADARGEV